MSRSSALFEFFARCVDKLSHGICVIGAQRHHVWPLTLSVRDGAVDCWNSDGGCWDHTLDADSLVKPVRLRGIGLRKLADCRLKECTITLSNYWTRLWNFVIHLLIERDTNLGRRSRYFSSCKAYRWQGGSSCIRCRRWCSLMIVPWLPTLPLLQSRPILGLTENNIRSNSLTLMIQRVTYEGSKSCARIARITGLSAHP